jgi:phage internal scaffolding protein
MANKDKALAVKQVRDRFTPNNPDEGVEKPVGESMTAQEFKDEVDINNITSRYLTTGMLPQLIGQPIFGEIPSATFQEMVNTIEDTKQDFLALPAKIRNRFDNDPYQLLRFVENPENKAEAIKLGLIEAPPEPVPAPAPPGQTTLPLNQPVPPAKAPATGGLPTGDQ